VIEIVDANTFVRPIYAGNALQTVQSSDAKKVITVRPTAFKAAPIGGGSGEVEEVQRPPPRQDPLRARRDRQDRAPRTGRRQDHRLRRPRAGLGRGVHPRDRAPGGPAGRRRGRQPRGGGRRLRPNDYQVGQTGKVVAPDLYIAVGISGPSSTWPGMKDSKVIVAINKDGDAPIFSVADYGLVGDYKTIVPR
jgi:electron transfer flavoprotein alpha subunit